MGVASLVLGIVSIVFALVSAILWWLISPLYLWMMIITLIIGIVGIIFGAISKKRNISIGIPIAGFVCSIVGTSLMSLILIISFIF